MLQIPTVAVQTPAQVPQGKVGIYFSLENHTSLAQASQKPDKIIDIHWIKNIFNLWPYEGIFMSEEHKDFALKQILLQVSYHNFYRWVSHSIQGVLGGPIR